MPGPSPQRTSSVIVVTGPLTRDEVGRWHESFAEGLVQGRGLRIDLSGSGPWDLAGVQLLLAAIASGRRTGWPIALASMPAVLTTIAGRAGLQDRLEAYAED